MQSPGTLYSLCLSASCAGPPRPVPLAHPPHPGTCLRPSRRYSPRSTGLQSRLRASHQQINRERIVQHLAFPRNRTSDVSSDRLRRQSSCCSNRVRRLPVFEEAIDSRMVSQKWETRGKIQHMPHCQRHRPSCRGPAQLLQRRYAGIHGSHEAGCVQLSPPGDSDASDAGCGRRTGQ